MSELNTTVTIASRPYKFKIDTSEEEVVQKAAAHIETKLNEFSRRFAHADKQDLLAMVLLDMKATQLKSDKDHTIVDDQLKERLIQIDHILDGTLNAE